jgi:Protein of unknown function (DUF2591)
MTKVSELTGAALDWAVAKAKGWVDFPTDSVEKGLWWHLDRHTAPFGERVYKPYWTPSTDWAQGGPIIEETCASVFFDIKDASYEGHPDEPWFSEMDDIGGMWHGPTPLIAAMRCYVANKLGNEVEIPEELL